MTRLLVKGGYRANPSPQDADVVIVNTCGFIGPARDESFDVLRELAESKRADQTLIAAGCLTQRYGEAVVREVHGIDGVLGTRRWMDVLEIVRKTRERGQPTPVYHLPDVPTVGEDDRGVARVAIQGASAYLKIADGCRRPCAFCAIPLIKGPAVSRPPQAILSEVRNLQSQGIREVILIAQDTTDYGHDLDMKDGLATLLTDIVQTAPDLDWIRVMYAYPGYVTDGLIEAMATHTQIIPYLDMPLQHSSQEVLKAMRRPANMTWVYKTIEKMRAAMPDLALRTTFIVGYPGETEDDFAELLGFVKSVMFDRVGVFTFSYEGGTSSEKLGDPVPSEVKEDRRNRLMEVQQRISLSKNQGFVGKKLDVLVEGHDDELSLGRSYRDAPEIDGLVLVDGEIPAGEMVEVQITGALAYDLSGIRVAEPEVEH